MATSQRALERDPAHGWDRRDDIREAERYLALDTVKPTPDKVGLRMIAAYAKELRSLGIRPKTAAKLIGHQYPNAISAQHLVRCVKEVYATEPDEPGLRSLKTLPRDKQDQEEIDAERMSAFQNNQYGKPKANDPQNIKIALHHFGVKLRFDEFQAKVMIDGLEGFGPILQDDGVRRLRFRMRDDFDFLPDKDLTYETLLDLARQNSFNPARDYFDRVQEEWDGIPRLERFLPFYAGATDTPYVRAVGLMPFVAAVRRVRDPGAKYDEMLVVESPQGKNKSSAYEIMAVRPEWFTDSMPLDANNRETLEHVQGKLFIECAELQGMKKADIEHVKALLSRTVDRGRMVWGRLQVEWPRQFVFIGTSNSRNYLKDETGNRRFWPVSINEFDLAKLRRDRDQLWGEAATWEALGESIRLDRALWAVAAVEQKARLEIHVDPFKAAFEDALGDRTGKIAAADAWTILGLDDAGRRTPDMNRRFGAALKACGWKQSTIKIDGNAVRGYVRGEQFGSIGRRRIVVSRGPDRRVIVEYEDERKLEFASDESDFG